ncbi:hypothetical protein [Oscillatoria acuminata]|uniref:hypothetical protein n=1 Tax=Oscillatoria acuminata TaxID=118323 RepID=UPI0012EAA69D|nr:hypothetical protein [Oscillatoria acuminata]
MDKNRTADWWCIGAKRRKELSGDRPPHTHENPDDGAWMSEGNAPGAGGFPNPRVNPLNHIL